MINVIVLVIFVCAFLIGGLLCIRTRKIGNRPLRLLGVSASVLVTVVPVLIAVLMEIGLVKQHLRSAPVPDLKMTATPGLIERGANIANALCSACHSESGPMQGGLDMGKEFPLPLGTFVSANLTPAGPLRNWSDGEVFRAIRNAIDADGRWLTIMSYTNTGKLSDEDIEALIIFLRRLPAAGAVTADPPDHLTPIGLVMLGAGLLPTGKPVYTGTITAPSRGPTAQYGGYLISYNDCRECHGPNLTGGGSHQLGPPAPSLGHVRTWTLDQFRDTLRTGVDPYGHELGAQMPWKSLGRFADDDLRAIYQYLVANVPP
jgi:mono/diheme cytochrome c family protein